MRCCFDRAGFNDYFRPIALKTNTLSAALGDHHVHLLEQEGSWYEEMINNRNKSLVRGMAWNADGQKICIVYDDGAVIVGSVDGNRIWGKELKNLHLHLVEWSPDGKFLLFGMQNGEVHVYEQGGNPVAIQIPLPLLHGSVGTKLIGVHWYSGLLTILALCLILFCFVEQFCVVVSAPLVLDTDMLASCLQWNHDGSLLAVTGKGYGTESEKRNMVKFFNPYGQYLHTLKVPGKDITACAWEGMGLRIALAVDSFIFFANIRPDYKWCFLANTVAYAFNKADRIESTVIFWNTNTNEQKAETLALHLGIDGFKFSDGWLRNFKKRYDLAFKKMCGESGGVDSTLVANYRGGKLVKLLRCYSADDTFNLDEIGLFYKLHYRRRHSLVLENLATEVNSARNESPSLSAATLLARKSSCCW
ncbi:hypothetical protein HPB51_021148 [Rhipicephalus microplus]|uniref:HTH CENPB-type domain-containing protein n=1 Tax=Rhipicephalus microplus TaxID=6941 RepID=A0A9J6DXQ3_RHIMP|nr:hypothetical protein HPB51_021148 [Rhipicephalus microplus]